MSLRARILAGELVVGPFQKTPSPQVTELLGRGGVDFVVVDQEHAPIGIEALDLIALAGRASGLPVLIRASHAAGPAIWPALDLGCAGVMVPHIRSAREAVTVAEAMKYARGRGFSPSGRAGNYGRMNPADYRARSDAETVFLAQIEDAAALPHLDEIAAVPEVDVLFIGPQDLALSLGCTGDAPEMQAAIDQVAAAAQHHGKAAGLFVGDPAQIAPMRARGISVFVCGSDQGLLQGGARRLMAASRDS
ncbi:HpcH/HpaI aldolase family protein [Paracoccus aminophilus]|uniref:HpcH/HpaI aldolase n=1 Tax=Paracoccus aminophilus JCM 7686 TaxID=1367847 RepID=S5YAQ0_PARAH|nr:aldolase/citrate lyase family protein [Paracoccus aminophilus]AGT08503.1 HpcH/HpaI aldolase [Paracoccus aminophilus JCM 7686]